MKKPLNIIYIALFIATCACPLIMMIFFGSTADSIGNEQQSPMPSFFDETGINTSFSTEFDKWISEKNPLRTSLINAENNLKINMLKSDSNNVISGSNDYLFSNETIDDYIGKTASDRTIYRIAKTVKLTQNYVKSNGSAFVFTVIPNKNTLYPEYMPARFIKSDTNNLAKLSDVLQSLDVNYADMKSALGSIESELYLRDDTHWNNYGALVGFNTITDKLGKAHNTYNGINFEIRKDFIGDLTKMAFPDSSRKCEQYYFNISLPEFSFVQPARVKDNSEMLTELMSDAEKQDGLIRTINPNAEGSLYILRDSFGRALLPYLIDNYNTTYITRYQPANLQNTAYDNVVWEVVERNLCDTVRSVPLIFAQECSALENILTDKSDKNIIKSESTDNSVSLYGVLDKKYFTDTSNIYVCLSNGNIKHFYEAYPIFESEKLNSETDNDYGFSLTLDKSMLADESYDISLIISSDDTNISTGTLLSITKGNKN